MALSWNEIKERASKFSKEWENDFNKAVDLAYRPQPFTSEANRMVFLFELYEKYTADLFTKEKVKKVKKK